MNRFGDGPREGGRSFSSGGRSGGFRRNNFNSGPREMHKAVCAECKKECEVPFKPTEGRPVYCKECFQKNNPR
jgi:CxxC-x17-CxxC domain-containing protein